MAELITIVENTANSQALCELEVWKPPQGTIAESIPLSLDLDFDAELIHTPSASFSVRAQRATIHLRLVDADLIRGSRLGEHVLDPQMTAEVTQSVRQAIETETEATGRIEVEVKPNIFGRLAASIFWKKRRSKKSEHDHIIKASLRISRIIPRTKGKWAVVEPVAPHLLTGRFLGMDGQNEVGPLCLITMRGRSCLAQVIVSVNRHDLHIAQLHNPAHHTRNKTAILNEMTRRAIATNQVTNFTVPPNIGHDDIVLARSILEVSSDN